MNGKGNGEVVAIGFTAGFVGAAAVLLAGRLLFYAGISQPWGSRRPCRSRRRRCTGRLSGAGYGASRSALS